MSRWFPQDGVNLSMNYFVISEKAKLLKYVLHAQHKSAQKKGESQNLKILLKEEFQIIWDTAN